MTARSERAPAANSQLSHSKYVLFAVIAAMMLVVLYRDRVVLNPQHWIWEHYRPFKWWLLPHAVTGGLALFLGPLQFSRRLRQHHLAWHRISGRVYVVGVVVAAPLGIVIEAIKYTHGVAPLRLVVGSSGFGLLFALTTITGFTLARRRRIRDHQKWMTRSYAIATVFLQTRCVDQFPWLGKIVDPAIQAFETHSVSGLWLHIAFSLLAAELVLRYNRTPQPRPATAVNAA